MKFSLCCTFSESLIGARVAICSVTGVDCLNQPRWAWSADSCVWFSNTFVFEFFLKMQHEADTHCCVLRSDFAHLPHLLTQWNCICDHFLSPKKASCSVIDIKEEKKRILHHLAAKQLYLVLYLRFRLYCYIKNDAVAAQPMQKRSWLSKQLTIITSF